MRFLAELSSADQLRVAGGLGLLCFGMGEDSYGQRSKP